ncbi:hypothetical protein Q5M85_09195 [Paraclostridium bifermentans]|nr:hypothetical protein [Paraclostridium bifermentans]
MNWNTKIKYTLYKTVEENLQYIQYRCDLGTYKNTIKVNLIYILILLTNSWGLRNTFINWGDF